MKKDQIRTRNFHFQRVSFLSTHPKESTKISVFVDFFCFKIDFIG